MRGYAQIANDGTITRFDTFVPEQAAANTASGVIGVRVNRLGAGGNTRRLEDGRTVLSLNVSMVTAADRGRLEMQGGGADEFSIYRVTGRHGTATITFNGAAPTFATAPEQIQSLNEQLRGTGIAIAPQGTGGGGNPHIAAIGWGHQDFVKVELVDASADGVRFAGLGAAGQMDQHIGATAIDHSVAGRVSIDGKIYSLGGDFGTTINFQEDGNDIEVDLHVYGLRNVAGATLHTVNIDLDAGISGLGSSGGTHNQVIRFGFGDVSTDQLGRGVILPNIPALSSIPNSITRTDFYETGGEVLGVTALSDLGSGGPSDIQSNLFERAIETLDRATDTVITEQLRLGTLQKFFGDSLQRSEHAYTSLASHNADLINVDAAVEITNLIQAQQKANTVATVLAQTNAIAANIQSLLTG